MLANPNQTADSWTTHQQGMLFGETVADQISKGYTITEVLQTILNAGPIDLREATSMARVRPAA